MPPQAFTVSFRSFRERLKQENCFDIPAVGMSFCLPSVMPVYADGSIVVSRRLTLYRGTKINSAESRTSVSKSLLILWWCRLSLTMLSRRSSVSSSFYRKTHLWDCAWVTNEQSAWCKVWAWWHDVVPHCCLWSRRARFKLSNWVWIWTLVAFERPHIL